ncbi:hypothetical protein [Enterocloster citroniae]
MKTEQLYKTLGSYMESDPKLKEKEVEIIVNEPSVGPLPAALISSVHVGFDWNSNRILITPTKDLVRSDYVNKILKKDKRIYEIVKCTNPEMIDDAAYNHWIGKLVSEPTVDKKTGKAYLHEFYDKNGNEKPFHKMLRTSLVSQINKSYSDGNECIVIITKDNYIFLNEVNDAERIG